MRDGGTRLFSSLLLALLTSAAPACSKTEGQSAAATAATESSSPPAASASASAAPTTTSSPETGGAAVDAAATVTPAGSPKAAASASSSKGSLSPLAGDGGASTAEAACGKKPQPDCPLQAWMKANTNPAIAANDLPSLAGALDKTAAFAPAGYTNWASIAKDGARAARAGDMTAAKASCRTCHDQYKAKYKAELRGRGI